MTKKNSLFRKFHKNFTESNLEVYKKYRNTLNRTTKLAKETYYKETIDSCGDFPSLRVTLLVAFFFHFLCSVGDVIGFALHVSFSLFQLVSNHHGVCCISVCLKFSLLKP